MPVRDFRWIFDGWQSFTITMNSLGANAARQSTVVTNTSNRPRGLFEFVFAPNTAPTAGTIYEAFLGRSDGSQRDDNAGASDAGITVHNAALLGTIANDTGVGTANLFPLIFDSAVLGLLGPEFFVITRNSTNQALKSTTNLAKYNLAVGQLQ